MRSVALKIASVIVSLFAFSLLEYDCLAQEFAQLHVVRVEHVEDSEQLDATHFLRRTNVWGFTKTTEYSLACADLYEVGKTQPTVACAPMRSGQTYEVRVYDKALGFPAEQTNSPKYAWYMIQEEHEHK